MAVISKIISAVVSFILAILNLFSLGGEKAPEFVLGENVNSNVAQVLEVYNDAVIETDKDAPLVETLMSLEELSMSGNMSSTITMMKPVINDLLSDIAFEDKDIPGKGQLKADDVISAKMSTDEGKTTVIIEVKGQTDDAYGDAENGGPVSRAMGTAGDLAKIFEEIGYISSGLDSIEIQYTDCKIACIIDETTGEIIRGEWYYNMTMEMDEVTLNFGETPLEVSDVNITLGCKSEF